MVGLAACLGLSPVGSGLALAAQDNVMAAEPPGEVDGDEAELAVDEDVGQTAGWEDEADGSQSDEDGSEVPAEAEDDAGLSVDDDSGTEDLFSSEEEAPEAEQAEAVGEESSSGAEGGEIPLSDDDGGSRAKTGPGQ